MRNQNIELPKSKERIGLYNLMAAKMIDELEIPYMFFAHYTLS